MGEMKRRQVRLWAKALVYLLFVPPPPTLCATTTTRLSVWTQNMFSPSPFPQDQTRRTSRIYPRSPVPSGKRTRLATGPSRLGNSSRVVSGNRSVSGDVSRASEGASEMDVDAAKIPREKSLKGTVVFSKSEELIVTLHAHLPAEAQRLLRNVGMP